MKNLIVIFCIWGAVFPAWAQAPAGLSLEEAYAAARRHYPLTSQRGLIAESEAFTLANAAKGYLPQLSISGQASYQSAVTRIPIQVPGMDIPVLSKDQYKLYGELSQVLYDGGTIRQQQNAAQANAQVETQQLEVELYQLQSRIQQLFFGILAIDEQLQQSSLLVADIRSGIAQTEGAIANGTALKSSLQVLQAELLQASQGIAGLRATRKAYAGMLGLFLQQPLEETVLLQKPAPPLPSPAGSRPELLLFDYQRRQIDIRQQGIGTRLRPQVYLFVQSGIGRPALNFLSNTTEPYALGGVRLHWPLGVFYTAKNDNALLDISRKTIALQRETFLLDIGLAARQQEEEIVRLRELLAADDEILALRKSIKEAAAAQLSNGVIRAHDYLREVHAEDHARQNKILHEIQLLQAQHQLHLITSP